MNVEGAVICFGMAGGGQTVQHSSSVVAQYSARSDSSQSVCTTSLW